MKKTNEQKSTVRNALDILLEYYNYDVQVFTTGKYQPYDIVPKYGADPIPDGSKIIILKDRIQAEK